MKISQEDAILVLKEYPSKQYGARRLLSELPNKGWKLVDRVRHIAVEDLVLSQEDKPKRHRSAREISHETAILRSSVHRIIHHNLQLKCSLQTTSCSADVYSQSHLPSHLLINNLTVCNKSCYCSIINCKLNNK